jgi:phospholipid/cholesterol/gamma-HCH transport system substrate-binding protein
MTMLRQLDKLGVVGTRVLNASRDNIVASLRHLQPTLTKLGDAGDALAPGLSMLASFPFPREAGNIVRGDYANALFHMDIDLNAILKSPDQNLPNIISLCSALPLAPACEALSPVLKATVCALVDADVVEVLCPPGSSASQQAPLEVPDLHDLGILGGSENQGTNSSSGGLGGLLGLGRGGGG